MGMYDSIFIKIKCPYCGKISEIECQTKELSCGLKRWYKGDNVRTSNFRYLYCLADCHSSECLKWEEDKVGYRSGFGRSFTVEVHIGNEGAVTGLYKLFFNEEGKAI